MEKIIKGYSLENNLKNSTKKGYRSALKKYEYYHEMSIDELVKEALKEEKANIPLKERKIRKRLISFRRYLLLSSLSNKTAKTYFTRIKSIYRYLDIEMPEIPPIKYPKEYESNYRDLPTKKEIRKAIKTSPLIMQAIILFMVSSGAGRAETLSLTVRHFINATSQYHTKNTIKEILEELSKKDNIVPVFYLKRIKTDKYYHTFCTPEATQKIIEYLKTRSELKENDQLFKMSISTLNMKFRQINDRNRWGFKGRYRFFRAHVLRKYHASNIGLPIEYIDELQGRGKTKVHEAYIKINPQNLKRMYERKMDNLKIIENKEEENEDNEFNISINVFIKGKKYSIQ